MIYKKMYLHLFKSVTMAITFLNSNVKTASSEAASKVLKDAQCECEEMFMNYEEENNEQQNN